MIEGIIKISDKTKPDETTFPVWFLKSHLQRALATGLALGFFWGFLEAFFIALPELHHPYLLGEMTTFIVTSSLLHAFLGALVMILFAPFIFIFYRLVKGRIVLIDPVALYISIFIFCISFILLLWQVEQLVISASLWGYLAHFQVLVLSLAVGWTTYRFVSWLLHHRSAQKLISDLIVAAMTLLAFLASRRLFFIIEDKVPFLHSLMGFLTALIVAGATFCVGLVLFRRISHPLRLWRPISVTIIIGLIIMLFALYELLFVPKVINNVERPNIVLITLDAVRADDLGVYNPQRECSPNLDRFAKESIVFYRAQAVAPITVPSHVSMLTGNYPSLLGIWQNGDRLADDIPTLAEKLEKNGYTTAAFVSSVVLESRFTGLSRGFNFYDDNFSGLGISDELNNTLLLNITRKWLHWDPLNTDKRLSENTVDKALQWLNGQKGPIFLWVHLFDAHLPYNVPRVDRYRYTDRNYTGVFNGTAEQARMVMYQELNVNQADVDYMHKMYQGEIYYQDKQVGRLLNVLSEEPWQASTMIMVCGDHGEGFEKDYYFNHVDRLWQTLIRVPLILHLPNGEAAGTNNYNLVSPLDIYDTDLAYAGLPVPEGPGEVLLDLIKPGKTPKDRFIFSFCKSAFHPTSQGQGRSIISSDNYKLIWHPYFNRMELYNLNNDPDEINNLVDRYPEITKQLFGELYGFFESQKPTKHTEDSPNTQNDALKGLGYIGN